MEKFLKVLKVSGIYLLLALSGIIFIVSGYLAYLTGQYYRVEDNLSLSVTNQSNQLMQLDTEYTATTFNIGFGAYSQDFSFFMDTGEMLDGTPVSGESGQAKNKEEVLKNTNGVVNQIEKLNSNFYLFQEVDVKGTRSHNVNQLEILEETNTSKASVFAQNFDSAFLAYPFLEPHGANQAGIATFSDFKIDSALRRSFPVDESFPFKYFDLDRCFSVVRHNLPNGKDFVLLNIHMSAYDEGGYVRAEQLIMLNEILEQEQLKGNYVVAGGDFNHDIANTLNLFPTTQKVPSWVNVLNAGDITTGYTVYGDASEPSCRGTDMEYTKGENYTVTVDGFIVSNNVQVSSITNLINGESADFMYSDHNPATLTFKLLS